MVRSKSLTTIVLLSLWAVFSLFYYNILNLSPHYTLNITKERPIFAMGFQDHFNETDEFLINTAGCAIPNYIRTMKFKPVKIKKPSCERRGVFIDALSEDQIVFTIREDIINNYRKDRNPYICCFKFVSRPNSNTPGVNDTEVVYSECERFGNGTIARLIEEVITVTCSASHHKKSWVFYKDAYIILKKVHKKKIKEDKTKWNVLILGMDTMSRARVRNSMPLTTQYFKNNSWLDYKAYHKVGENTYPNLMAILSGNAQLYCKKSMDSCNNRLLWSIFKSAGYATAYGEDNLHLPDTFRNYGGFEVPPTDHYMRPFFLLGEHTVGNRVCSWRMSSAIHLLDYARQLTKIYENDNFFGLFWINSYSHNLNNNPALFDKFAYTFLRLVNKNNTFVFFISDHGIRFGETRYSIESFYEERLPMLYIWVPHKFREQHPRDFNNMQVNQNRLVNTYDLHDTMWDILKKSDDTITVMKSTACPQCTSIFDEKSVNRTCKEAAIDEKWCSCRKLLPLDTNTSVAKIVVKTALYALRNATSSVKTKKCTRCVQMSVKTVLRVHSHFDEVNNKIQYVVAFLATPGEVGYEVIVDKEPIGYNVTVPLSTITSYNAHGTCVSKIGHRGFCVCQNIPDCHK